MNRIVNKIILLALLFFSMDLHAQVELSPTGSTDVIPELVVDRDRKLPTRKNIYLELGGSGGFASFNFEWIFFAHRTRKIRWLLRPGFSVSPIDKNNGMALIFPVMAHGIYGKHHCLDVGVGQTFKITTRGQFFFRAPLSIGYRLEPKESRLFYRFSYTPIVSYLFDQQWEHWGGISIGYKIK